MTDKPEALRLACLLEDIPVGQMLVYRQQAAAELRRLHELNAELLEALKLALSAHGTLLLSDPPQEAWKTYNVEAKARAAIAKATGEQA